MQALWDFMATGGEEEAKPDVDKVILDGMKRRWGGQMIWASMQLVICGIIAVVGIYFIGQSIRSAINYIGYSYINWNPFELEFGIFITLVGTILIALSTNFLMATWKKRVV